MLRLALYKIKNNQKNFLSHKLIKLLFFVFKEILFKIY